MIPVVVWTADAAVRLLDQTALPADERYLEVNTAEEMAEAIRTLKVRGAPLIGIAAAMGLVAGLRPLRTASREPFLNRLADAVDLLRCTRPTAVNLAWALNRMVDAAKGTSGDSDKVWERLRREADAIWEEDRAMCRRIGEAGLPLVPDGVTVLTHCNAGALATGGIGTALAPIYLAHEAGRRIHVFVSETRPVLQGARLTAWELTRAGVSCTVLADSAAGALLKEKQAQLVLVGADRIARNGDFANKIGTYPLAVLARAHGVPFYCAAPSSTFDPSLATGQGGGIVIEQRPAAEIAAPAGAGVWNPAFDVTPGALVTGFVTDRGVLAPPFGD